MRKPAETGGPRGLFDEHSQPKQRHKHPYRQITETIIVKANLSEVRSLPTIEK